MMWNNKGTNTLNVEQGKGSMRESNFLCSKYDGRDDLATNETDSWEKDHSCETRKITAMGNT